MPPIKAKLESAELTNHPSGVQRLLDACLAADPSHITPHQKGEHVKVLQRALMTIAERSPEIGLPKINDKPGEYESDTIATVLKYKAHFKIVRSGQALDPIVGRMTITQLDNDLAKKTPAPTPEPDPATDPTEKGRVEVLLAVHRPGVPVLIGLALDALPKCKAALELAKRDPFNAQQALRANQLGIDGLDRHFHISGNNTNVIDTVVSSYRQLLGKVPRLPLDQAATDYPTFKSDAPEHAFNDDGTPAKVPAFSDNARGKMFFNPIYRPFNPAVKEPFSGLAPIALQGVQLHEMCHFYLNMADGNPAASNTAQCLSLAQSFQLFAMQLALGRPFP